MMSSMEDGPFQPDGTKGGVAALSDERSPTGADQHHEASTGTDSLSSILGRRWVYEVSYAIIVLGAAALILSLVGRGSGWPIGAAFNNELILVPIYAAHFRHLDFFPVWSSSDGLGLGTPVLLFYHKAFFYVAGFIFILCGGALKQTLIISIALFLVVGAYGMRQALTLVTDSRLLRTVGSVGFLFTNYVFTDWLTRGDLPEFSAMMIVPWLLYWCLNLVKNRRVSLVLIPVLALLVDAHSAIGLISVITLAITMITFLAVAGMQGLRAIAPRLIVAVGGATVLLAPTLLAEVKFGQAFDPESKVTLYGKVANEFVGFGSYFYDGSYRWLASNIGQRSFVQIDFAIWIPIAIVLIGAATLWVATRTRPDRTRGARNLRTPGILMLLASLSVYLFLQWPVSLWLYRLLSPLQVVAYPYRMLTFITPIGVILVIAIANYFFRLYPASVIPKVVAVLWLVALIALSPITSTWSINYAFLAAPGQFPPTSDSAPPRYVDYQTYKGFFSLNGIIFDEYLPKVSTPTGGELSDDGPLYVHLHKDQYGAGSLSKVPCTIVVPSRSPLESLQLTFTVTCHRATRFALPVTFNAYSKVFVGRTGRTLHPIPYFRVPTDPRIVIDVKSSRSELVVVHLPTLWGTLF
jgi:hypothetical protein